MEPLYCGHLEDLVERPVDSGTPLLWTLWGCGEVSTIEGFHSSISQGCGLANSHIAVQGSNRSPDRPQNHHRSSRQCAESALGERPTVVRAASWEGPGRTLPGRMDLPSHATHTHRRISLETVS